MLINTAFTCTQWHHLATISAGNNGCHEPLTHWGWVTHICVGKTTIIGSDNGLSPGRRQAIIWTNAGILLTGPLGTNLSEILIGIQTFSFKKMHLKTSSAKWHPFLSRPEWVNTVIRWQALIDSSVVIHDDTMAWKWFPYYWSLMRGIYQSLVDSIIKINYVSQNQHPC